MTRKWTLADDNIKNHIINNTSFLNDYNPKISERVYCYINSINTLNICAVCEKKKTKFYSFERGYRTYCSEGCASRDSKIIEKKKKTCLKKYGGTSPFHSKKIKQKAIKTNKEKYGADWFLSTLRHPKRLEKNITKEWCYQKRIIEKKTIVEMAEEKKVTDCTVINYLKYYDIYEPMAFGKRSSSAHNEIVNFLITELKISNIEENKRKYLEGGYEIDIYLPDYKFGIEFHGLYWHSFSSLETHKERMHHYDKYQLANAAGITLFQFFEHQWNDKKDIIKSMITHKIGMTKNKIFARNTALKEIDYKTCNEFLLENHLNGDARSSLKLGLFDEDELVSVMTFGSDRFTKESEYIEIIRHATKKNVSIPGGFEKLLFNSGIKKFKTYKDNLLGGSKYNDNFSFSHMTTPNYWYYKKGGKVVLSRYKCQKQKLHKILGDAFMPEKSESENMFANGYRRFWDAGNTVYTCVI